MLAVLRRRDFALVWVAGLISLTGDWFLYIALPLVVYDLTGSTAATAAAVAARVVPRLALGPVAGVFVDRWDRRRTMLAANLLLGCCLLPLLLVRSADLLWLAYLATAVQAALAQFLGPAENALLPRLVGEELLVPANALNGLNNNLARLIGPPLGGLIVAASGLGGAVLLDAASFCVAAGLVALVRADGRATRAGDTTAPADAGAWAAVWRDIVAGLALIRRARTLAILFALLALTGIGEGAMGTLFAPFVLTILGGGGVGYGAILAAQAVGGLVGNAAIGQFGKGLPPARLLGLGAIGLGAIDLLIFNAHRVIPGVAPPIILMVIVGVPAAGIGVGFTTLLQEGVADDYRGRVFSAFDAAQAIALLPGAALAGALGNRLGIVPLLNIQGGVYLLAGIIALATLATVPIAASTIQRATQQAED